MNYANIKITGVDFFAFLFPEAVGPTVDFHGVRDGGRPLFIDSHVAFTRAILSETSIRSIKNKREKRGRDSLDLSVDWQIRLVINTQINFYRAIRWYLKASNKHIVGEYR